MFKEHKILKVSLGILFFVLLLIDWSKDIENKSIFISDKISYFPKEKVISKSDLVNGLTISSIQNVAFFTGHINDLDMEHWESDLYLINNKFPIVVKPIKCESKITVVFPFVNNLLYVNDGNGPVINESSDTISLFRHSEVNHIDFNLFDLVSETGKLYQVISDYDLIDKKNWEESKLVIIYGKTKFYSQEMIDNLIEYVKQGGDLFIFSSSFARHSMIYDTEKSLVIKKRNVKGDFIYAKPNIPFSESYGGLAKSDKFVLFKNGKLSTDYLKIVSSNWSGFATEVEDGEFRPLGQIMVTGGVDSNSQSGIYKYGPDSGEIYYLGSECFLYDVNYRNAPVKEFLIELLNQSLN